MVASTVDEARAKLANFVRHCIVLFFAAALLSAPVVARAEDRALTDARNKMVDEDVAGEGVKNPRVINAMRKTKRHEFVPLHDRGLAYFDMALPIGEGQTISPPFVVAYMTESIDPQPGDVVLEIGTGSGYQAAVLSPLVREVYTIEIVPSLGHKAEKALQRLGYTNVHVKVGDGYQGWPEHAPFDKIIVTCSPEKAPPELVAELKEGGRMVIPVGQRYQQMLYLLKKTKGKMVSEALLPTLFVPMTGVAEKNREVQPDPLHPCLRNGDFQQVAQVAGQPPRPVGWHYVRQAMVTSDGESPSGKNYLTFVNREPGRCCQALQGFPVDGRKVPQLDVSLVVRGRDIRPGATPQEIPALAITFYDEKRVAIREEGSMGPWVGSFSWQTEKKRIAVPARARDAILRIGLLGAVGELSVDNVKLKAAPRK
jgi:protein-L-isoaspartate(D-aspartate) O-methyltransferase